MTHSWQLKMHEPLHAAYIPHTLLVATPRAATGAQFYEGSWCHGMSKVLCKL